MNPQRGTMPSRNTAQQITPKQYDFVKRYITNGFNASQAALDAGYSEIYANKDVYVLLTKPHIKQHVETAQALVRDKYMEQVKATQPQIIARLMRLIDDVLPLDESQPINKPFTKDALKAIEIINKMVGYNAPEKRVSMTMDMTRQKLAEIKREYEDY